MVPLTSSQNRIRPFISTATASHDEHLLAGGSSLVGSPHESNSFQTRHQKDRRVFERLQQRVLQSDLPGKEYVGRYLTRQYRQDLRANTLDTNLSGISLFLRFIQREGKRDLSQIIKEDLEAFVEHEQDRGAKPVTVYTRLASANAFMKFLIEQGVVDEKVLKRRVRVKVPDSLPRAMEAEDVRKLLSVIDKVRDRAMVLMLLRSGMRIGELLELRVSDLDLRERKVMIYEAQKTRVGRVVYFTDDAGDALRRWLEERNPGKEFLFYGNGRESLGYAGARAMFVKYIAKAELSEKGHTIHCLRHTFASELLNAGMRLECLQHLLGHTSLEVTRRYARLTDKTREEEYFRAMAVIERGESYGHC